MLKNKKAIVTVLISIVVFLACANQINPYGMQNSIYLLPILILINFIIIKKHSYNNFIEILEKQKKSKSLINGILSIYLIIAFNLKVYSQDIAKNSFISILIYIGYFMIFYIYLTYLIHSILEYKNNKYFTESTKLYNNKRFIVRIIISIAVGVFFLLIYYPGLMSPDSIEQWRQVKYFDFSDYHNPMHTLTNYFVSKVYMSPATICVFQILLGSLIFNYGLFKLEEYGLNRKLADIFFVIYIINPANSIMMITLWKDIDYSIFLFLTTVYLFLIHRSNGLWMEYRKNQFILGFTMSLVYLYRYNGIVPFVFIFLGLIFYYKKQKKQILKIFIFSFLIIAFFNGPINKYFDVKHIETGGWSYFVIPLHQIGAMVENDIDLENQDELILEKIMPINNWKSTYNKNVSFSIVSNDYFNVEEFKKNKIDIIKIWIKLVAKNPKIAINAFMYETSVLWQIDQLDGGYIYTVPREIFKNDMGLETKSKLTNIKNICEPIIHVTEVEMFNWIFWRPGIHMFFGILGIYIYCLKTNYRGTIIAFPMIFNLLGLLGTVQAQDIRYMYISLISAPFLFGLSFLTEIKKN